MRRRILTSTVVLVVVAALLTGILMAWRSADGTSAKLTDGSTVRFVGLSLGTARFTTERAWHRTARRILPKSLQGWIPKTRAGSRSSSSNSMTLFLEQFDTSGAINTTRSWAFYGTEDENGTWLQVDGGYGGFGSELMAITLRTWPRRESHFRLKFLDGTGTVIGSLHLANPVKGPFPLWSPQPLPQTRTNGPVVLTLRSIRESHPNSLWPAVAPNWGLHSSDPQWRWADVRSATFHDATGNEGQWLPRNEPAWKAATLVYRKGMDNFLPAERIVVENVTIPKRAEFVALDQTFERAGVKIILQVLVGESGRSTSSNGRVTIEDWGDDRTWLKFETQGQQADDVIELILRDDRGEILKVDFSDSHSYTATSRTHRRRFSPPAEAKSISIEMAVNRPLPFEFMFGPQDIQAPVPAK